MRYFVCLCYNVVLRFNENSLNETTATYSTRFYSSLQSYNIHIGVCVFLYICVSVYIICKNMFLNVYIIEIDVFFFVRGITNMYHYII